MTAKSKNPLRHMIDAARCSLAGLLEAWRSELALRLEAAALLVFVPLAFWLGQTAAQRALLIFSLLAVPMVEMINSAIEAAVDRIGPEIHILSGRAKNMGSAAVLLALVAAGAVWALIAWERFR